MKINKLFHWLYAMLMLLPIFAIGVTCGYVIFNDNAYLSYSSVGSASYTEVVSNTTLINNATYRLYMPKTKVTTLNNYLKINFNKISLDIEALGYQDVNGIMYHPNGYVNLLSDNSQVASININNTNAESFLDVNIYFEMNTTYTNLNNNYGYLYQYSLNFNDLDNVFYYSLDNMKNNPLFSWANNNFLTNPFSYLFNLFGVPTNSGIMTLLSYWLDISIIWLVFDLIMYVPLLAHRWIDKGMID